MPRSSPLRRGSVRLLEFQHEFVHRHLGLENPLVARIFRVTQPGPLADQLEPRCLDLALERAFLDPMQGLADRGAGTGLGRMIGDDQSISQSIT